MAIIVFLASLTVGLVLHLVGSIPSRSDPSTKPVYVLWDANSVHGGVQGGAGMAISATKEPVAPQASLPQDGPSILEGHCTRCHVLEWLIEKKKPRSEWEKTLGQMEANGVRLDDAEKLVLLDYLTAADQP